MLRLGKTLPDLYRHLNTILWDLFCCIIQNGGIPPGSGSLTKQILPQHATRQRTILSLKSKLLVLWIHCAWYITSVLQKTGSPVTFHSVLNHSWGLENWGDALAALHRLCKPVSESKHLSGDQCPLGYWWTGWCRGLQFTLHRSGTATGFDMTSKWVSQNSAFKGSQRWTLITEIIVVGPSYSVWLKLGNSMSNYWRLILQSEFANLPIPSTCGTRAHYCQTSAKPCSICWWVACWGSFPRKAFVSLLINLIFFLTRSKLH